MKHILFLKEVLSNEDLVVLDEALSQTRAIFSISLSTSSITIEGSNDVLHHVKQAVMNAGYTIQ